MSDERRKLVDQLRDASLYEAPALAPPGDDWRRRLLAARFPLSARAPRFPLAGLTDTARLILFVALPVAVIIAISLTVLSGFDFTPRWPESLPQVALSRPDWLRLEPEALSGLQATLERWHLGGHAIWYFLAVASTLLTFIVRRRVPRLLPLDW